MLHECQVHLKRETSFLNSLWSWRLIWYEDDWTSCQLEIHVVVIIKKFLSFQVKSFRNCVKSDIKVELHCDSIRELTAAKKNCFDRRNHANWAAIVQEKLSLSDRHWGLLFAFIDSPNRMPKSRFQLLHAPSTADTGRHLNLDWTWCCDMKL